MPAFALVAISSNVLAMSANSSDSLAKSCNNWFNASSAFPAPGADKYRNSYSKPASSAMLRFVRAAPTAKPSCALNNGP